MTPRIVEISEVTLIGLEGRFIASMSPDSNAKEIIYPLWEKLTERKRQIRAAAEGIFYGACSGVDPGERTRDDELIYLAGVPVKRGARLPDGMAVWEIPSGAYALFTHRGPIQRLGETIQYAYRTWLPQSCFEADDRPELEYYDQRFRGDDPESEVDYLLPIRTP